MSEKAKNPPTLPPSKNLIMTLSPPSLGSLPKVTLNVSPHPLMEEFFGGTLENLRPDLSKNLTSKKPLMELP
jgi:hypothetical protein